MDLTCSPFPLTYDYGEKTIRSKDNSVKFLILHHGPVLIWASVNKFINSLLICAT